MSRQLLFTKVNILDVVRMQEKKIAEAANRYMLRDLEGDNYATVVKKLHEEFEFPKLTVDFESKKVDSVSGTTRLSRHDAFLRGMREGATVDCDMARFRVPFEGDVQLFEIQPSTYWSNSAYADIEGRELWFQYPMLNADAVKEQFARDRELVMKYVDQINRDADKFNQGLGGLIETALGQRKQALDAKDKFLEELR